MKATCFRESLHTRGIFGHLMLLACAIICISPLWGDTKIVDGAMEFEFEIRSGNDEVLDSFFEYENDSNSQKVIDRRGGSITVRTRADLSPFESSVPFPVGDRYRQDEFAEYLDMSTSRSGVKVTRKNGRVIDRTEFVEKTPMKGGESEFLGRTARRVTEGAETQHEAVERIMRYIRKNVSYQLNTPSNPVDVLRGGKAYCEGYANAAALLVRSLGIPAQVMDSYIPPGHMWGFGQEGSGGYHAHVEIYYEDAGWVSYDPQASVHYVDPFHIVNYPRRDVRIVQLEESDKRHIIDRLYEPANWDNFYQRKTDERRHNPLLVGTIYTRNGRRVEDSFRSGEWVYRRISGGEGAGIRILANGTFAVSPKPGEEATTFFYRDGNGGWLEETASFDGPVRKTRTYRLDEPEQGYTIQVGPRKELYLWFKDEQKRWRIDAVEPSGDGSIFLLSQEGRWIVSRTRDAMAPKYLLDAEKLERGGSYAVEELPRYFDPESSYVAARLPEEAGTGAEIKLIRSDGARTDAIPVEPDGSVIVPLPSSRFVKLLVQGDSYLGLKMIGTPGGVGAHLVRPVAPAEGVSEETFPAKELEVPPFGKSTRTYTVKGDRPGAVIYLVKKSGRRFNEYGRTETDAEATARIAVDPDIAEEEELFVLYGTPQIRDRAALSDAEGGMISFE